MHFAGENYLKISNEWLQRWVDHGLTPEALGHRLTMAGLELDAITPVAAVFSGVVVGRVQRVQAHPDADKLRVCEVDDGSGTLQQVVCGAPNVHEGMCAPLARVGAVLPDNFQIKKAKLRGVESFGMLCSAKELGLAESSDGLLGLPHDSPPGMDVRTLLGLDDVVLEIDLTPNRADCLSIAGVAREVATLVEQPLIPLAITPVPPTITETFPITLEAPQDCPRYAGRVIRGVNPQAPTPLWMRERLRRCGIRSLGPLVDVTNYVMLELGQPMHAFDLAHLHEGIVVRRARAGERLQLLAGQEIELSEADLLIADGRGPLALAGIMGGDMSGVDETTRDVFLESAHFSPQAIAGRARSHGLHTDASHRFERGVDPQLPVHALERATALLLEIVGGQAGPVHDVIAPQGIAQPAAITLRPGRVEQLLGAQIPSAQMQRLLQALGCHLDSAQTATWQVWPPSFRFDLAIEEDLIEEVARVYGYDQLPRQMPPLQASIRAQDERQVSIYAIRRSLSARGYREAITYSFVDPAIEALLASEQSPLTLVNPISSEMAAMRTTLWPGLIKAAQYNLNRQQARIRLFETGLSFVPTPQGLQQQAQLAALVCGPVLPEQWGSAARPVDFFDLKGDLQAVLALAGLEQQVVYQAQTHTALHPGQSARLLLDDHPIGWLGALHPQVQTQLDLPGPVYVFEVALDSLRRNNRVRYQEQSRFPLIRRDLALLVDETLSASTVINAVRTFAPKEVKDIVLFDVYTGKGLPDACKSLALGLILQDLSRTLTDTEVDAIMAQITQQLAQHLGIRLRG